MTSWWVSPHTQQTSSPWWPQQADSHTNIILLMSLLGILNSVWRLKTHYTKFLSGPVMLHQENNRRRFIIGNSWYNRTNSCPRFSIHCIQFIPLRFNIKVETGRLQLILLICIYRLYFELFVTLCPHKSNMWCVITPELSIKPFLLTRFNFEQLSSMFCFC